MIPSNGVSGDIAQMPAPYRPGMPPQPVNTNMPRQNGLAGLTASGAASPSPMPSAPAGPFGGPHAVGPAPIGHHPLPPAAPVSSPAPGGSWAGMVPQTSTQPKIGMGSGSGALARPGMRSLQ